MTWTWLGASWNGMRSLDRSVLDTARAGHADRAVRLIVRARGLDRLYGAVLRAEVAQILFTQGRDREAFSLAEGAHRQARGAVGLAPYVAGLAAWRMDRADASHGPCSQPPTARRCPAPAGVPALHSGRRGPNCAAITWVAMHPGCSARRRTLAPSMA